MVVSVKVGNSAPKSPSVLAGWKAIATHFGCNARTARRYEQDRGLPVHRAPGKKGSTVFAYVSELDAWLESREKEIWPADLENGTAFGPGDLVQKSLLPPGDGLPSATSVETKPAQQVSFRSWRLWVFAAALLALCAGLYWKVENRRASAASPPRLAASPFPPHLPAPGAENLLYRGRYFWNLRTAVGLTKAIDAYTQAIVKDPFYAEAYAGLAECYDLLPQFGNGDFDESMKKAEQAADRAIALDPNLAAAHRAKAFALSYLDWDFAGSDAEFKRALELDPNSPQTHQWYAGTLECRSEGAEALRQIDEAVRLDPGSPAIAADAALFHAQFGDFQSGLKALKEIEQTQPTLASPPQFLRGLDFDRGDFPAYIEDARRFASITHDPDDVAMARAVAQGWARGGRTSLLEARVEVLKAAFEHGTESGFQLGETLLLLGRRAEALFYFKASLDRRALQLVHLQDFPWAQRLSSDPGYAAFFAQVHQRVREAASNNPKQVRVETGLPQ